jgi:methylated-DNA-[protein]-cysteine S-methyltransferase
MQTTAPFLLRVDSPVGKIQLTGDEESVTSLTIEGRFSGAFDDVPDRSTAVLERAAAQLAEYFAGTRATFDVPVRLDGTEFQRAVWRELATIEFGDVLSYGDIGRATGRPAAGRAVGGAVGANPVPILIPCHRVLATNRQITGYSAGQGIPTKVWLLDHEGIDHR